MLQYISLHKSFVIRLWKNLFPKIIKSDFYLFVKLKDVDFLINKLQ